MWYRPIQSFDDINYVQTDAAVSTQVTAADHCLDMNGQVLGMNTWGVRKDIAEGLNFAIHYNGLVSTPGDHDRRGDSAPYPDTDSDSHAYTHSNPRRH